jgi:hypothetical protein
MRANGVDVLIDEIKLGLLANGPVQMRTPATVFVRTRYMEDTPLARVI